MNLITTLYNLVTGTPTIKHDLRKKPTREDLLRGINCWIQRNFYIICLAAIVFLLITFVMVCYMLVGVSATESGTYYNGLKGVV